MPRGSAAWTLRNWGGACTSSRMRTISFGGARIQVDSRAVPAFRALAAVMAKHKYSIRAADTGAYVCRYIAGTRTRSNHSWGTAVDVNWRTNPFQRTLKTDMPKAMRDEALALRTKGGAPVFRWGGNFRLNKDAMHWEITATPREIASGIVGAPAAKPPPPPPPTSPSARPVIRQGDSGIHVRHLQTRLGVHGFPTPVDGDFGPATNTRTRAFQTVRRLVVDGVVGAVTWRALDAAPPAPVVARPVIRQGASGAHVRHLQTRLTHHGFPTRVDGDFGPATNTQVRAFQRARKLGIDGIVGPATWKALG